MIILNVKEFKTFKDYIKSLSKKARKNWKYCEKHNQKVEYRLEQYNKEDLISFMALWEEQLIRGEYRRWAFGINYLDKLEIQGRLMVFTAIENGKKIALHFVENHNGYIECHPPMYDKEKYSCRYLAKFMWFGLIKWGIEHKEMEWLDFGGGIDESWREMIKRRKEFPNPAYKWMYIPEEVKNNPDSQPNLSLQLPQGKLGDIKYLK